MDSFLFSTEDGSFHETMVAGILGREHSKSSVRDSLGSFLGGREEVGSTTPIRECLSSMDL